MSDQIREEFEAWYLEKYCGGSERLKRCPHDNDTYYYCGVQAMWTPWQASRTSAQVTIDNQAQMIEHLRGGLTTPTNLDVANADADGFKNGRKSVGLLLRKGFNTLQTGSGEYKIVMQFSDHDDAWAAYNEVGAITRLAGEE